jgi:hypothetical protein
MSNSVKIIMQECQQIRQFAGGCLYHPCFKGYVETPKCDRLAVLVDIGLGSIWFGGDYVGEWKESRSLFTDECIVDNSIVEFVDVLCGCGIEQLKHI